MDAIQFVNNYLNYLDEISLIAKPELQPLLDALKEIDPHDLVSPETYFNTENSARGYVWWLFLK
jgi:hypothetical protein